MNKEVPSATILPGKTKPITNERITAIKIPAWLTEMNPILLSSTALLALISSSLYSSEPPLFLIASTICDTVNLKWT